MDRQVEPSGATTGPITVALVDDHPATVAGLTAWLQACDPPLVVLAAGPTPASAWTHPGSLADVVVLDLQLGRESQPSYANLKHLVEAGRRVVVYTMLELESAAITCLNLGAATVLTKAEGSAHLVGAIVAAAHDLPYVSPALSGTMAADRRRTRPQLSSREAEALVLWFQCESKHLVATRMGVTDKTVATFLDRARIKYALAGRPAATKAALLARAIQDGLIDPQEL